MNMGKYVAVSAAIAQENRLDAIANNLANSNTTGFKRDRLLFESYLSSAETDLGGHKGMMNPEYVKLSNGFTDYSQGPIVDTGNKLDIAIMGSGFLMVDTPQGIMATRNGNLKIGEDGALQTVEGYDVLQISDNGEYDAIYLVDPGVKAGNEFREDIANMEISSEGDVFVTEALSGGVIKTNKKGKIALINIEGVYNLDKYKGGLYKIQNYHDVVIESDATIKQGFLEGSNVNAIQEMTQMIAVTRSVETYQKIIQAFDEMDRQVIEKVGEV